MSVDLSVVQGDYFRDLLNQPEALRDTLQSLSHTKELRSLAARLRSRRFKAVVLTGMGSSLHALNPLLLQLTGAGHATILTETSELVYYRPHLLDPNNLLIAVSQSGRSAELIRLLHDNRGRAPIITITNTPDSPLARRSNAVIFTHAGEEFSVSCKTYVCALLAIKFLGDYLCGIPEPRTRRELATVARPVAGYLDGWQEHVASIVPKLQRVRQMFLVGRGPSLAAVGTGALILKESVRFPAEGLSSAGFRHGPFEMVGPETFVLVFSGEAKTRELNQRLLGDIRANGGSAELVSQDSAECAYCLPKAPVSLLPVLEILPVQMLTLALAAMNRRQPGRFRLASKVTTTE